MFLNNGYPKNFFEKTVNRFLENKKLNQEEKQRPSIIRLEILYLKKTSHRFVKNLSNLVSDLTNKKVKLSPIYKTFKVVNYFQLKSTIPCSLHSNVVYRFSCPCDMGLTYIGMSSRHLIIRTKEHVNFQSSQTSTIKSHIEECQSCQNSTELINQFSIIKKCASNQDSPTFVNKAKSTEFKYTKGSSFLLKIFLFYDRNNLIFFFFSFACFALNCF